MNNAINCSQHKNKGLVLVEFTIIASAMLIIFFALFEAGRYVYSLQMLNEATRRAARLAAVCPVTKKDDTNPIATAPAVLKVLPSGFDKQGIKIDYLMQDGVTTTDNRAMVWFVRARITNVENTDYLFFTILTSLNQAINLPDFSTTLRAEGLGAGNSGDSCP